MGCGGVARRRFGVSIPEDLAARLDRLSDRLGVDRSSLVEKAIKSFLEDYGHLLIPHRCSGILILTCSEGSEGRLASIIEDYRDITTTRFHTHTDSKCIEALILSGEADRIMTLHQEVERAGCRARYIPLP